MRFCEHFITFFATSNKFNNTGAQISYKFVLYILTKVKTLYLNCLPFIYKMMQASEAIEVYPNVQRLRDA